MRPEPKIHILSAKLSAELCSFRIYDTRSVIDRLHVWKSIHWECIYSMTFFFHMRNHSHISENDWVFYIFYKYWQTFSWRSVLWAELWNAISKYQWTHTTIVKKPTTGKWKLRYLSRSKLSERNIKIDDEELSWYGMRENLAIICSWGNSRYAWGQYTHFTHRGYLTHLGASLTMTTPRTTWLITRFWRTISQAVGKQSDVATASPAPMLEGHT